jgi:putative transposase
MYRFVWIPKYRHKVFVEPYREAMKAIFCKIGYDYDFDIQELEIPEEHIHMVIKREPKIAPSHVIQVIKSISAREFYKLYPDYSNALFLWRKTLDTK